MATVWQNGRATRGREDQPMADSELARLQRRYRALTEQIRDLGFIATGSVIERYTVSAAAPTSNTPARSPAKPSPSGSPPSRHSATASRLPTAAAWTNSSQRWTRSPPRRASYSSPSSNPPNAAAVLAADARGRGERYRRREVRNVRPDDLRAGDRQVSRG